MMQQRGDRLDKVREAVTGLPSGDALIAALNELAGVTPDIMKALIRVINEAKKFNATAEVSTAPRCSLDAAKSIVSQLMFLSPR